MSDWIRVNRQNPCPQCGKDSWCTYKDDVVLCMRVASDREKVLKSGEVGWLHQTGNQSVTRFVRTPKKSEVAINASKLMEEFLSDTTQAMVEALALNLKVQARSLRQLGCAWAAPHAAWAFPMFDGYGSIVGIRLRATNGRKWAVTGSHQGIFCPPNPAHLERRGWICEGPTDTAAALSLGLYAIGRPSCSGGVTEAITSFKRNGVTEAVIIADNDTPGLRGAQMLQNHLPMRSCIVALPAKDIREAVRLGLTGDDLEALVSNLVWQQPNDQAEASDARGRPIANPDAPAALPPAHG